MTASSDVVQRTWNIREIIAWSTTYLAQKGFATPRLDVEVLLGKILGLRRIDLYAQYDRPVSPQERSAFKHVLSRRVSGEPVAYIVGRKEFMGVEFEVTPEVLIPRPDTEILVEAVELEVKRRRDRNEGGGRILDIGTGSGCIALVLAKRDPDLVISALDISPGALAVAGHNALKLGLPLGRVTWHQCDILSPQVWTDVGRFDIVVSNPPYVTEEELQTLSPSVRDFEPKLALVAANAGLIFYENIAQRAAQVLPSGGKVFVEIGATQRQAVVGLFSANGWVEVGSLKDYSGCDRVVVASLS